MGDYLEPLVEMTRANLNKEPDAEKLKKSIASVHQGDGWKGCEEHGPYDAIHVGAAAEQLPSHLVAQLKVGGRMVVPIGEQGAAQILYTVDKMNAQNEVKVKRVLGCRYVPLVKVPATPSTCANPASTPPSTITP